jgi:hypothetical protein
LFFHSCLFFPALVSVTFFLFSQSCSRCFLPVSSLSRSDPFSLCVVMGSIDLGWSIVLAPSRFASLDKKAWWFIVFLFFNCLMCQSFLPCILLSLFSLGVSTCCYPFLHLCCYFAGFSFLNLRSVTTPFVPSDFASSYLPLWLLCSFHFLAV